MSASAEIKIYNGYGHTKNLVVYGHVFKWRPEIDVKLAANSFQQMLTLLKLFMSRPYAYARLRLVFMDQIIETESASDGFFKFKWTSEMHLEPGIYDLKVGLIEEGTETKYVPGKVYVPSTTQYAFVSDIDDTVLISHSASLWRRLRELLARNPYRRRLFEDNVIWYNLLSNAATETAHLNPFFYVSSSEWNLYDYLHEIFRYNGLPTGSFLLSHFKQWYNFFKSGRTKHDDKYRRIDRLLRVFPKQKFVLIGDNSQRDPIIYTALANRYPDRIVAIFIRNIKKRRSKFTLQLLKDLAKSDIRTCLFENNHEAIEFSLRIGLIQKENLYSNLSGF
ncbi:App1 family protein [Olivibacter sp. SDN3]|uniref:App1 family protein n=1 Tax=Olivibacter sp. SDN3 TaxID=2764720 RepID=UPI0016515D94|nr:App1 family protein [Olivibacter sp. SDN3]QNL50525.1 App1 family protein [Olivibacter sp. SDN3]